MDYQKIHPVETLTHLDGRNGKKIAVLRNYFSELAWNKYRIRIVIEYLRFIFQEKIISIPLKPSSHTPVPESPAFQSGDEWKSFWGFRYGVSDYKTKKPRPSGRGVLTRLARKEIDSIWQGLNIQDGEMIWNLERSANHDLRALELFIKEKLNKKGLAELSPYINFGVGSEDINNIAIRLQLKDVLHKVFLPEINLVLKKLVIFSKPLINISIVARTHGQVASITTLGKELALFISRLLDELHILKLLEFKPKFSGEVGNFNTLKSVNPEINWLNFEQKFLNRLEFKTSRPATQIAPYEDILGVFDSLRRINQVFISFAKDIWLYASLGYFTLKNVSGEAGSAGMPHKINPIYFEGAEGGFEIANSLFEFFSRKLPQNPLQREFSDSTVRRNFCLPFAYSMLSCQSLREGLSRLDSNRQNIERDVNNHWEVMSETLHTYLKMIGRDDAYVTVRNRIRGRVLKQTDWLKLIESLDISLNDKKKLNSYKPTSLVGESKKIAEKIIAETDKYFSDL